MIKQCVLSDADFLELGYVDGAYFLEVERVAELVVFVKKLRVVPAKKICTSADETQAVGNTNAYLRFDCIVVHLWHGQNRVNLHFLSPS